MAGLNDGFTMKVSIINRKNSSRISSMKFEVNSQQFIVDGFRIRRVLADDKGLMLPSDLFLINQSSDSPNKFFLIGAGFGHGRGMCQWGAIGMSLKGTDHKTIIGFYYPDYSLGQLYE